MFIRVWPSDCLWCLKMPKTKIDKQPLVCPWIWILQPCSTISETPNVIQLVIIVIRFHYHHCSRIYGKWSFLLLTNTDYNSTIYNNNYYYYNNINNDRHLTVNINLMFSCRPTMNWLITTKKYGFNRDGPTGRWDDLSVSDIDSTASQKSIQSENGFPVI